MVKMNAREKMAERTRTAQYRKLLTTMRKEADLGKSSILTIMLLPHTKQILESEGFKIEETKWYGNVQHKISW